MAKEKNIFESVISHSKEYGFVFQGSEIYDGLGAVYDYGNYGSELKKNIREYWWRSMVHLHENIVGIDSAIFMHPKVWKASGHVDGFSDPMIDNKDSKKRYRADQVREVKFVRYLKDVKTLKAAELHVDIDNAELDNNLDAMKALIEQHEIVCPISGTRNWTDVRQFNLMYSTQMGSVADDTNEVYLRPETAQGIFTNFLNVQKSGRMKIPFGIAHTGKAFRNEIVARQFIMRMREFEQMEMQFFVRPGTEMEWYEYWKESRMKWHLALGTSKEKYRFHNHVKLAHYANAAVDIEFDYPIGFKELEGIHSRTDFDLSQHQKFSGKKLQYFDPEVNANYVPYVIETSIGLDRMFLAMMCNAYSEEKAPTADGKTDIRTVLKLHPALAPVKVAVLPLVKKDGLPDVARAVIKDLKLDYVCQFDEKDAIGKRYRRQDAIGTPFCVTIDYETLSDEAVTIRYRDTMEQHRVRVNDVEKIIADEVGFKSLLSKL